MPIRRLDIEALKSQFQSAQPFPHICIDGFLEPAFADELAAAFPPYSEAKQLGREFATVNEKRKVQVCDYDKLPQSLQRLADALSGQTFIDDLSKITGIPDLLWDPQLIGGGMHQTASSGHLDIHVDFNRAEGRPLFRRLNILVYLNPGWQEDWGGGLELWDAGVERCCQHIAPLHNRCVVFATGATSFHGVAAVTCPPTVARKSFAAYYYTRQAPAHYSGVDHTTIFKARPDELLKGYVLMPAAQARRAVHHAYSQLRVAVKRALRPS